MRYTRSALEDAILCQVLKTGAFRAVAGQEPDNCGQLPGVTEENLFRGMPLDSEVEGLDYFCVVFMGGQAYETRQTPKLDTVAYSVAVHATQGNRDLMMRNLDAVLEKLAFLRGVGLTVGPELVDTADTVYVVSTVTAGGP